MALIDIKQLKPNEKITKTFLLSYFIFLQPDILSLVSPVDRYWLRCFDLLITTAKGLQRSQLLLVLWRPDHNPPLHKYTSR